MGARRQAATTTEQRRTPPACNPAGTSLATFTDRADAGRQLAELLAEHGVEPGVVLAVPVAPPDTVERPLGEADEVLAVGTPPHFGAVGQFYRRFDQVSDEEAAAHLR